MPQCCTCFSKTFSIFVKNWFKPSMVFCVSSAHRNSYEFKHVYIYIYICIYIYIYIYKLKLIKTTSWHVDCNLKQTSLFTPMKPNKLSDMLQTSSNTNANALRLEMLPNLRVMRLRLLSKLQHLNNCIGLTQHQITFIAN